MRGHLTRWSWVVAVGFAVACGADDDVANATTADDSGLEQQQDVAALPAATLYRIEPDGSSCDHDECTRWNVTPVNLEGATPDVVAALDFSKSGLSEDAQSWALRVPYAETLLSGVVLYDEAAAQNVLHVQDVLRALPGTTPSEGPGAGFYRTEYNGIACITSPCPSYDSFRVNTDVTVRHIDYDASRAIKPNVDRDWVTQMALNDKAISAGNFVKGDAQPAGEPLVLAASSVFVSLQPATECAPVEATPLCAPNTTPTYSRDADRCYKFESCKEPVACTLALPVCEDGYTLIQWRAVSGCPEYRCEPNWLNPVNGPG